MPLPSIVQIDQGDSMIEVLTTEDVVMHQPYAKTGYPETKTLHGHFLQIYKGEKACEGDYANGKRHGVWAYFVNNAHHPLVREFYHEGRKTKQEVLQNDGHHLRMVFMFDEKERPLKQITYADDGVTIVKLDVFQNGVVKEENKITPSGQEQTVFIYNQEYKLMEKHFFANDELTKIEKF